MTFLDIEKAIELSEDLGGGETRLAELTWLAMQAGRHICIAEVGAWVGASTNALARNTLGKVWTVDTWDGGTDGFIKQRLAEHDPGWAFAEFSHNTADIENIEVLKLGSLAAAAHFRETGQKFDMIFIDASHDYESVKADVLAWLPLLTPDGLLCGDDYEITMFPEVVKAVDEATNGRVRQIAGTLWAMVPGKYK